MNSQQTKSWLGIFVLLAIIVLSQPILQGAETAPAILSATGIKGGLVVHLDCGDGKLTAALHANDSYLVHGLDADTKNVASARRHIQSLGLYGKVTVEQWRGARLPYVDNLVNLLVAENLGPVPMAEVLRVLAPNGVALIGGKKTVKPLPQQIDEWTHYLHSPGNNAVSQDTVVGPPRHYQWVGSPRYGRHHDNMSSLSAMVSSGGRLFYIFDEGSSTSILLPPKWHLIARDAFSGVILWKRPIETWNPHLWPLKSGPAQLPRRLVAVGDTVYVTLGIDAPVCALDAATGKTLRTYEGTEFADEVIFSGGILFLSARKTPSKHARLATAEVRRQYNGIWWDGDPSRLLAIQADSGRLLWQKESPVVPVTLAADADAVYFHDGEKIVCLEQRNGAVRWSSPPVPRAEVIRSFFHPTLVVNDGVVLFAGGETAGKQTGSWYREGKDSLTALSAKDGQVLWSGYHPPSGYRSPEDVLVANGFVWSGETTSGRAEGHFTGRDLRTGEVKVEFDPDIQTYWFHHRCYRGKATVNYLLMGRAGTEFIDIRQKKWIPQHWVRGACLYGVMPANGLLYAPQHPCACYLEAKLSGLNALAPARKGEERRAKSEERLERGPAYGASRTSRVTSHATWLTYRHDAARSGTTSTIVSPELKRAWQTSIDGRLSSLVCDGERIYVAAIDTHTVHVLDATSGKEIWNYTAGGRVDSPPTIYEGRAIFGSADGWIYCLRAADGALGWRFRAAPDDRRMMAYEQVESVWPVHGSVLIRDGAVYAVAGRSMFVDGGLRLVRLDARTGRLLSETVLDDRDPAAGKDLQDYVSWLNMPPALPDVLSSDGRLVYMRSQAFAPDGTRLPLKPIPHAGDADAGAPPAVQDPAQAHLFCPTGLLDDSAWHRTYWMYGSFFVSGWAGYYKAGKAAPAGRILAVDDTTVYGFGRKPQYYRWTTPMEYRLFATGRNALLTEETPPPAKGGEETKVTVAKSKSLNPANTPLAVEAWVKADRPDGVILARGGQALGYVLALQGGRPYFGIRANEDYVTVDGKEKIVGRWVHLAGVLNADRQLALYVDGQRVVTQQSGTLIPADPAEAMEIGEDASSTVGNYQGPLPFAGLIDEVRVYHGSLTDAEINAHATDPARREVQNARLVLHYSFDHGRAHDESGNKNNGQIHGAQAAAGKHGKALVFKGAASSSDQPASPRWTLDVPLFARALVLANRTLFVAGPPDVLDEEQALRQYDEPATRAKLAEQEVALAGKSGALLWAVSADDGRKQTELKLDTPPVFDGMIAAAGALFMATMDGKIQCYRGSE